LNMRASKDFETFNGRADAGGNYVSAPFDDGSEFRQVAQVFQGLSARLGKIADKAAATSAYDAATRQADAGIGLPEVSFKLKPGKVDESGTGRREPQGAVRQAPANSTGRMAELLVANQGATRNKPVTGTLSAKVQQAVASVYGDGYKVQLFSGGQDGIGQGNRRTGSTRHDHGKAGDWYVIGPDGKKLEGDALAPLGQFWAASKFGGVGMEMRGGGIHLDEHTDRAKAWNYADKGGRYTPAMKAAIDAGLAGRMPQLRGGVGSAAIGGNVNPQAAFTPSTPEYEMQVNVPEPKPLALRRDGTIAGDAHDRAIFETAGWKMQAGMDAELGAAYENNKDDPAAFQAAIKEVADKYVKQAGEIGPEVSMKIKERAAGQLLTFGRDVASRNEQKVEGERKTAALAAVDEATKGIDRQAYLIGANEDGDERLSALASQAHASVDAALASGAITPEQARGKREDIATGLVTSRIQGVFDALDNPAAKLAFVDGLDEQYADPSSPLAALAPETFKRMRDGLAVDARQMTEKATAASALQKYTLKRAMADDLASLETTGQGGTLDGAPIDANAVARALGPDDAAQWLELRGMKRKLWEATSTMPIQNAEQIEATLARLEPKAGEEGFAIKQQVFEAADKQAQQILKQRREDPAAAAELAFPEIAKAEEPQAKAFARLDAQAALGVPEKLRQPLTVAEARGLADRIELVEDNPDALQPELETMMGEMQKQFGPLADNVMVQVFEQRGIGEVTAQMGLGLMREMNLGQMPTRGHLQVYGEARRTDMADKAMAGDAPKPKVQTGYRRGPEPANPNAKAAGRAKAPNAAQINLLRKNPEMAPQFDAKFGQGAAEQFSKNRDQPVRRKLANGAVELTYPDGWVETLNADGSVDGRQGP
jgi:hypothetical protein